ncbi:MAG: hypothetical protein LBQ40_02875 [Clostridiales bacterium]|jgi:hypothetical protein|nr:hypothetical protein [Clostridiales bacterium]
MRPTAKNSTIQSLATEAKKRMKLGYWSEVKEKRRLEEREGKMTKKAVDDFALTKEEERYYSDVKNILEDCGEVIINPIGRLMDKQFYAGLDYADKQLYVFRLSQIYISIKNKIAATERLLEEETLSASAE